MSTWPDGDPYELLAKAEAKLERYAEAAEIVRALAKWAENDKTGVWSIAERAVAWVERERGK